MICGICRVTGSPTAMAVKKYLTLVASERYLGRINDEEKDNTREA